MVKYFCDRCEKEAENLHTVKAQGGVWFEICDSCNQEIYLIERYYQSESNTAISKFLNEKVNK